MKDYPDFNKLKENKLPCPDNYGGCDFLTEYDECQVLLDGMCPVCGQRLIREPNEQLSTTPDECWEKFKEFYPYEYAEAKKQLLETEANK